MTGINAPEQAEFRALLTSLEGQIGIVDGVPAKKCRKPQFTEKDKEALTYLESKLKKLMKTLKSEQSDTKLIERAI